ncbi:hypothetical protein RP726_05800 [Candidatus Methylospira mobilis]|uniref:hypothetical protein n=1 Tax=Candidatus Methylospira mobilis TaxID=1808979 RepID=UPI0028E39531|nr:hypothetical protein [Candidatus Methylospira mobilis]WNV05926.1 hypothetical protein RP726_05800 [Candidatus Methylospira mobilis]
MNIKLFSGVNHALSALREHRNRRESIIPPSAAELTVQLAMMTDRAAKFESAMRDLKMQLDTALAKAKKNQEDAAAYRSLDRLSRRLSLKSRTKKTP